MDTHNLYFFSLSLSLSLSLFFVCVCVLLPLGGLINYTLDASVA